MTEHAKDAYATDQSTERAERFEAKLVNHAYASAAARSWRRHALEQNAENIRLRDERAWQPIDTAPKDGTAIWLLVDGHPYIGFGEAANWLSATSRWFVKASYRRRNPEERQGGLSDEIYGTHGIDVVPTHWMPLPEPPK